MTISKIEESVKSLVKSFNPDPAKLDSLMIELLERVQSLVDEKPIDSHVSDGINEIGSLFDAFSTLNSRVTVLLARDLRDKINLLATAAAHAHKKVSYPVILFSNTEDFGLTFVSVVAGIDEQRLRSAKLLGHEWPLFTETIERFRGYLLWIHTQPHSSLAHLEAQVVEDWKKFGRLGALIVDLECLEEWQNCQLQAQPEFDSVGMKFFSRLRRDFDCPVVLLSRSTG